MSKRALLIRFSDSSSDLANVLQDNVALTEEDRLFIENHLLMIQMAYTEWKQTNTRIESQAGSTFPLGRQTKPRRFSGGYCQMCSSCLFVSGHK